MCVTITKKIKLQGRFKSFMVEQESNLLYKLVADNSLGILPLVVHGLKDKKTA
ncbi:hypothetical protein CRYPD_828 [uncultured Candidatus Thioglobus sp.]|nr:hypothetical protein CRYPD_828 [uncultured Candidatus Thioglobus sp.]